MARPAPAEPGRGWSYRVNMRLVGRFIPREAILDAVETFELVEAYPDDKYLPSYLVLGRAGTDAFHALFAKTRRFGG